MTSLDEGPRRAGALALLGACVALLGCPPEAKEISVWGTLYECMVAEDCDPVGDADVTLYDDDLLLRSETTTADDGTFTLDGVPGQAFVFMVADKPADAYVASSFLAVTGSRDGDIPEGALFIIPLDEAQAQVDAFTDASPDGEPVHEFDRETDGNGGMARGRFLAEISGFPIDTWPGRDSLSCYLEDDDGNEYPCRYYDKDGVPDWDLETTTLDGGWAAFGLPTGLLTGVVLDGPPGDAERSALFFAYVVEDGVTVFDAFTAPF